MIKITELNNSQMIEYISYLLLQLNFQPHIKGFKFISYGVFYCLEDYSLLYETTGKLYPKIANEFNTTPSAVEKLIRRSISNVYADNNLLGLNNLMNCVFYQNTVKPSNSEFIGMLTEIIRLRKSICEIDFNKEVA